MTQTYKIAGAVIVLFGMSLADIPYLSVTLVPEAQAFRGRGAAFVVGAAVGSARSSSAQASAAASQQQAAAAQQQAAVEKEKATAAQQQAAAAQQQAAAAQQQAAAAQQQAAAAQQQAATPAAGKLAGGHRRGHPSRRLHPESGRRRGVPCLRQGLLSCGVSGEHPRVRDGAAVTKRQLAARARECRCPDDAGTTSATGWSANLDGSVDLYFGPNAPREGKPTGLKPFSTRVGSRFSSVRSARAVVRQDVVARGDRRDDLVATPASGDRPVKPVTLPPGRA